MSSLHSRTVAPVVALVVALVTASGCRTEGLAFRNDERVTITSPSDRETVTLPIVLRWESVDVPADGSYAVYLDEAPVAPGGVFEARQYEAFLTTGTELIIDQLPARDGDDPHTATIVLLDSSGRRVGESAWDVTFDVSRAETG